MFHRRRFSRFSNSCYRFRAVSNVSQLLNFAPNSMEAISQTKTRLTTRNECKQNQTFSFEIRHAHRCSKPCSDWSIATVHVLTVLALAVGCRDHRQSAMLSRIRDHRYCVILLLICYLVYIKCLFPRTSLIADICLWLKELYGSVTYAQLCTTAIKITTFTTKWW